MVKGFENFIKKFYLLIIFIFLYMPIAALIVFSFNDSKTMGKWSGFTLRWYVELFNNENILKALFFTIVIAIISSIIATIIGTLAAIGINKMKGPKISTCIKSRYSNWGCINEFIYLLKTNY